MKEVEKTLVLVKPDAILHTEEIINIFIDNGLTVEQRKTMELDDEIVAEHYAHLVEFPFYPSLREFMTSAPVEAIILSGENAVSRVRTLVGVTDSTKADIGTIRNLYGTDKQRNAVHASDSVENAAIEIDRFFNRKTLKLN